MSGAGPVPRASATRRASWVPQRQDVIWIDCNPQAGGEMRDRHPMLVLSPGEFNARTGLVIGLPMTTADYNASNPFAVAAGVVRGRKAGKTSYVLCHPSPSPSTGVRALPSHTRRGEWRTPPSPKPVQC